MPAPAVKDRCFAPAMLSGNSVGVLSLAGSRDRQASGGRSAGSGGRHDVQASGGRGTFLKKGYPPAPLPKTSFLGLVPELARLSSYERQQACARPVGPVGPAARTCSKQQRPELTA